jgi:hypothetical protein
LEQPKAVCKRDINNWKGVRWTIADEGVKDLNTNG